MPSTPDRTHRSAAWFDNAANIDMTALYLERYLNFGISIEELRSGRPVIGIAQTGSDLSPCNRHHLVLADRLREGDPPGGYRPSHGHYHAGGVPAVIGQLMAAGLIHDNALTVTGKGIGENCRDARIEDERVIRPFGSPLRANGGFIVLSGNLFDSAVMKTSVISDSFRARYLSDPDDPEAFEGPVVVFDGPEDYHARIDDPALAIDERTVLVMRGAGPIGYPGAAEVVNMRPPDYLLRAGVRELPCIGDGRQSGTSGSPSILNVSPEAAVGGGLALLRTEDRLRIDLRKGTVDALIPEDELARRRAEFEAQGGFAYPEAQTPWQAIQRTLVGQLETGAILEGSETFQRIVQTRGLPRDNH